METGDPETEINCQVSGAEGGLCVPLLGGVEGAGSSSRLSQDAPPPCAISFPISIPLTSEAGVSLESDKLVNYEMSV